MAKAKKKESKKKKKYMMGIIIRILFLFATAVAILAIGYYYFGWKPLGPKIGADEVGRSLITPVPTTTPVANDLGSVLKDAIEQNELDHEVSPSPTATPTPGKITQEDQDALSNFLKKEIK